MLLLSRAVRGRLTWSASHGAPLAALPVLIAALAVLASAQLVAGRPALAAGKQTVTSGTAIASQRSATGTIISLRTSSGRLMRLVLGKQSRVTTGDGRALRPTDIYDGDLLTVSTGDLVQDVSQRMQSMKGIVSDAPQDRADPIVVQISSSTASGRVEDIVVDTDTHTRYSDRSRETSSVGQLQDADIVALHGVYDRVGGEMTQTDSISRLGPFRQHKTTTRKKS
jgi:hypothetical protein